MYQQQVIMRSPKQGKQKPSRKRLLKPPSKPLPLLDRVLYAFLLLTSALFIILIWNRVLFNAPVALFVVLCILHFVCGIISVWCKRITSSKKLPGYAAGIFFLSFCILAYPLFLNPVFSLSAPVLLFLLFLYATISLITLATILNFEALAFLGLLSLLALELATANLLGLNYIWWPPLLMLLSLPGLLAYPSTSSRVPLRLHRLFAGRRQVFSEPAFIFMQFIQMIGLLLSLAMLLSSVVFSFSNYPFSAQEPFVILCGLSIFLIWFLLSMVLTRTTRTSASATVYIFLGFILATCYTFKLPAPGYIVVLPLIAALYHLLDRFVAHRRPTLAKFGPMLDRCALALALLVPFLYDPILPLRLFRPSTFRLPDVTNPGPLSKLPLLDWNTLIGLAAIFICVVLTASAARLAWVKHKRLAPAPGIYGRPWLLFVSGMLLFWGNTLLMLHLYPLVVQPMWSFLTLTLLMLAGAVEMERYGKRWSRPFEALALCGGIITLILCMSAWQTLWMLLLLFVGVSYGVALYLRRFKWLLLPFSLGLPAIVPLLIAGRPAWIGMLALLLPLLAIALRTLVFQRWKAQMRAWEWPLLGISLSYTLGICLIDATWQNVSPFATRFAFANYYWLPLHIPFVLELGVFALYWYVIALAVRAKGLLVAATAFGVSAMLSLPGLSNGFHIMAIVTLLALCLAPLISLWTDRIWALALYSIGLLGVLVLQFITFSPLELVLATLVLAVAVVAWLAEGYIRGERILVGLALALIGMTLLRALSNPAPILIGAALILSAIAIVVMIKGRKRFQII